MRYQNTQINAYQQPRSPKQHELKLLQLIKEDHPEYLGRVLDIGCATGSFIKMMNGIYPAAHYIGIDTSDDLITLAREKLVDVNADLLVEDALSYQPTAPFGIIIASGILSIFEEFESILDKWLSWLDDGGRLYIFGRFNSRNIDTIIRFRNNVKECDWETGLTSYSVHTVAKYLEMHGFKYVFKRFCLDIELPEREDPIRTYTVLCADGSSLVVNGANIIAEHYFLTVQK